jgi:proline iminopeptidase
MTDAQNHINAKGQLNVGDGHQIYWEDWGDPSGVPIISLHGGPGNGFNDTHKTLFDPAKHHVIFHDQRGCGKSTPFASIEHNTTQDLIHDIELLREKFGLEKVHVVGGSWGSSLALCYAIAHPEHVKSLLIWGVYLIRQFETDWVNEGYPRYNFPTEWARFIELVPEEHRANGNSIMKYYAEQMRSSDPKIANRYAVEWTLWESTLVSIAYDPAETEKETREDPSTLSIALLETHYFTNNCFVPENYILDNLAAIHDIPCQVIQGRFDMCTPPIGAYDLAQAYGDNLTLKWVNSGHLRTDPEMFETLKTATQNLEKI